MNILIKLMSIVSLVIAPTLAGMHTGQATGNNKHKISIEKSILADNENNSSKKDIKTLDSNAEKLVQALAADKLLDISHYDLVVENGKISINGITQPATVNEKFNEITSQIGSLSLKMNASEN